ncbi:phosphatidylglycerophosphatase A [Acidisoma cellulosilytica]|uniref:Phosphatidylglycerophosphatase A n=1 Tax=Acidisoma cellulosilyticum TaxID=2802395 RepID=A0A963YZW4_9PROT|nr:phosphatidylglycerophosphatase A [Acidisoma cellulosilyticum]MCB8879245.1 phosphatidylglycerophosphatase A [Acidisoma cellulosilyticum]
MTFSRAIASVGGTGFFPWAPGTAGSLVGLVLGCAILAFAGHWVLFILAIIAMVGGILAIRAAEAKDDPGWVVIDEVAGQWLTLLGLSHVTWIGAILAFALFRLLDITKPGPIGWADRMHSPTGVMLDDVIAGVIGGLLLWAVLLWHPALFG